MKLSDQEIFCLLTQTLLSHEDPLLHSSAVFLAISLMYNNGKRCCGANNNQMNETTCVKCLNHGIDDKFSLPIFTLVSGQGQNIARETKLLSRLIDVFKLVPIMLT